MAREAGHHQDGEQVSADARLVAPGSVPVVASPASGPALESSSASAREPGATGGQAPPPRELADYPQVMTPIEVAEILRLRKSTVYQWVASGRLPAIPLPAGGGRRCVRIARA